MDMQTHGDEKYRSSELLDHATEWQGLRVEHRQVAAGGHNGLTSTCTELVFILSGQAKVERTGDGQKQVGLARPGTSWLVPAGTHETQLELDASTECLHMFLPADLLQESACLDFDLNPDRLQLAYIGGRADPTLAQLAMMLQGRLGQHNDPMERLFVEGLRVALSAHLVRDYSVDPVKACTQLRSLDPRRLRRVIDFIEARLSTTISLADLAAEACLSPFHFSRLFNEATGLSPMQYVIDRRIRAAQGQLASGHASLTQIAFGAGFGSQANFTRAFRKITGVTPGHYRKLQRH